MTEKQVQRILTEQTQMAVDWAEMKLKKGQTIRETMDELKKDLKKILKGEIIYT